MAKSTAEILASIREQARKRALKKMKAPLDDGAKPKEIESLALQTFKAETTKQMLKQALMTDTEFWVALCFQSREQKEEFLERAGWLPDGDKYLDGIEIAKKMNIELTPFIYTPPQPKAAKGKLAQIETLEK